MTPKNRNELEQVINDAIANAGILADESVASDILKALESHGCSVVPVEITEEMLDASETVDTGVVFPWRWARMLSANPFKE